MNRSHTERIRKQCLRQWQRELGLRGEADISGTEIQLTHKVSDPLDATAPTHAGDPRAHRPLVDELGDVQSFRDIRVLAHHGVHLSARDGCHEGRRDGLDAVVHLLEQAYVEVAAISRHQERQDLPRTAGEDFVTAGPAVQDHEDVPGTITFADEVLTLGIPLRLRRRSG